ncbi:MAG TPA: ABC transporter ATP-binding protein, partial [Microbacteriaceae bacterium]|nr:ABC transporter ATP-binding protein [Microbacteriaceae bacterium]
MAEPSLDAPRPQGWLRRLGGYLLRHRRDVIVSLVAAVLGSGIKVITPLIARVVVDDVVAHKTGGILWWIVALLALAVIGFGFAYLRRFRAGRAALDVQNDLRREMHDRLQGMDAATLDTMPTGQLVARANSDTGLVLGLLNFYPLVSGNVLMMLLSLVVMFVLSPLLALISLAVLPALLIVSYRMRSRVFPASWDGQQKEGDLAGIVDEDIAGVRVVKAFGQEGRELRRLADSASALYGSQMRTTRIQARFQPMLEAIPQLGQVGILALGGLMALHGELTLGTFLAFSSYIAQLMAPARQLAGILTIAQQARAGVERIFQLLDRKPAIVDEPGAVDLPEAADPGVPLDAAGEIAFRDVRFTYPGASRPVLDGLTLTVRPGERVALVGASGSGKSTIIRLLARYYEADAGTLTVGGVDVRRLRLGSLRRAVGLTFEDSFLFSESVRANIAYGDPAANDEAVVRAARAAQADDFIRALPHGYDTVVGERGLSLSGGQRQRIALARVLLRDPRILVLDDATSAIDARTEQAIHDGLRREMAGRTVLIVAHRHSTLHLADRIVVVEGGRVADEGTHDELIERSARYRALFLGEDDGAEEGDVDALVGAAARVATTESAAGARPAAGAGRTVSLGAGLGRGGGGWRKSLAPTPELLALVDRLEPVKDVPEIDLERESRRQAHFSLGGLLREFRKPLALALVFVVIDALSGLVGPALVKAGVDQGVVGGSTGVLYLASGLYLAIVAVALANEIGEVFVTGRVAQRIMLSLRIRIFAQLQRLSLDYYEREMAGRIMTRMTTDVDQFDQLLENGLLGALVAIVTFVGVAVALVVLNVPLGLATLAVVIPLIVATFFFRRRASRLYTLSRERIAVVNAAFQEGLSGVREAQAFTHEDATIHRFAGLCGSYLESRVAAQRLVAVYFPFVQFLSSVADAIVLGLGAYLIATGHVTTGTLIAFLLYIDMFFSPIGQLSQVFDSWQQTRVSVGRIAGLMRLDTLTPEPRRPVAVPSLAG